MKVVIYIALLPVLIPLAYVRAGCDWVLKKFPPPEWSPTDLFF
ncbi:hypothetical protein [Mycobacterium phage WXIN]|nr:hypothetical protein [Mycobacterium phage WXIN]